MLHLPRYSLALAFACALAALSSGVGYRLGWWPLGTAFNVLRWSAYAGVAVGVCALAATVLAARRRTPRGTVVALLALAIAGATFGIPATLLLGAKKLPAIHDITTDTANPPEFVAVLPLRRNAPNPARYDGEEIARQQRAAYGDIAPYDSALAPDQAFARALQVARDMGWIIVTAVPAEGRIEATDTTPLFGFRDDVVIRVTARPQGSRVDVRSVSRLGKSDVGTNARRIRRFLSKLAKEAS